MNKFEDETELFRRGPFLSRTNRRRSCSCCACTAACGRPVRRGADTGPVPDWPYSPDRRTSCRDSADPSGTARRGSSCRPASRPTSADLSTTARCDAFPCQRPRKPGQCSDDARYQKMLDNNYNYYNLCRVKTRYTAIPRGMSRHHHY